MIFYNTALIIIAVIVTVVNIKLFLIENRIKYLGKAIYSVEDGSLNVIAVESTREKWCYDKLNRKIKIANKKGYKIIDCKVEKN